MGLEELNGSSELEVVVGSLFIILCDVLTEHLHTELIERVIIAAPYAQRHPGITTSHEALHALHLLLLLERLFLGIILHLQEHALPL